MAINSSLGTGVSALKTFNTSLNVTGNNIANANTTGYKSDQVDLADNFSNMMENAGSGDFGNVSSKQVGTGVRVNSIRSSFDQGTLVSTNVKTDVAIDGDGFFHVVEYDASGTAGSEYYTRAGNFATTSEGLLVTQQGYHVQGQVGATLTPGSESTDLTIPSAYTVDGTEEDVMDWEIGANGEIVLYLSGGTSEVYGRIELATFSNMNGLEKTGNSNYIETVQSGTAQSSLDADPPGTLGTIHSRALELSNVDLSNEMAELISSQRSFQAGARIITTADQVLQEVIALKR